MTWMFILVSVVVISVATVIVTRIVGNLAEANLVRAAEENTAKDAFHILAMMRNHRQHTSDAPTRESVAGGATQPMAEMDHSMDSAATATGDRTTMPAHDAPTMAPEEHGAMPGHVAMSMAGAESMTDQNPEAAQQSRSLSEKQCSKRYASLVECKDANYSTTKSRLL